MGRGKVPGFRFVCGEPEEGRPIRVVPLGIQSSGRRWLRQAVTMRVGQPMNHTHDRSSMLFTHSLRLEMQAMSAALYAGGTIDAQLADRLRAANAQVPPDFAIAGVYILSLYLALDACPQDQGFAVAYHSAITTSNANAFLECAQ